MSACRFFWISGWAATEATSEIVSAAAAATLGCVSCRHSTTRGMAAGRQRPTCTGVRLARMESNCRLLSFFFHARSPIASRMGAITSFTPCGASWETMATAAASAASRTTAWMSL